MGIRVIQEGDVVVTTEQLRRFTQEWEKFCSMHINPCGLASSMTTEVEDDQAAAMLRLSTVWKPGDVVCLRCSWTVQMCVQAIVWSQRFKCPLVECSYFDARLHRQVESFRPEILRKCG